MGNKSTRVAFNPVELGALIRRERKAQKRSQQWLADTIGIRRQGIIRLEAGRGSTVHVLMTALAALDQGLLLTTKQMNVDRIKELLDDPD